jgi:phosphoenolpyruvate synthase/pyruvate phosphate dikinase
MQEKEIKMGKDFVKWFSELNKESKEIAGEKGANLGELYNNNLPVPEGFVITIKSFETFLEKTELKNKIFPLLNKLNIKDLEKIKETSEIIRKLIISAELPKEIEEEISEAYETLGINKLEIERGSARDILNNATEPIFVAVRSSLYAPIRTKIREQDTYLNIKKIDSLLSHVKKCFASIFREETIKRAIEEKSLTSLKMGIVVQKMIQSEKSGIIFSKNLKEDITIKAIWGLGEGMNLEKIIPDQYIISKELKILNKKIGDKKYAITRDSSGKLIKVELSAGRRNHEVLQNHEAQKLTDLTLKIEKIFENPQEIEFALEEENSYLVQTREIKKEITEKEIESEKEEIIIEKEIPKEVQKINKITKTKLKLILDSPYFAKEARKTGINKIGLAKIEKIIKETKKHPKYYLENNYLNEYEKIIYEELKEMSEEFEEIFVRTSDIKSDEFNSERKENNPFMGLHGIRFGLKYPEILKSELRAIKRLSSENKKIGILIPQITSIQELKQVKEYLKELNLDKIKIGIIIETPAAVQLIKDFAEEEIDLILIETDNLIQSLLVLDKNNSQLKEYFEEMHPALIYQLEYLIRVCKRREIETTISGNLIKNEKIIQLIIQKGINSIVVNPEDAKEIADKIYKIEEEIIKGTDKEPRQYEVSKEKEILQIKEEKENSNNVEENIEAIEKEKKEYLEESPEEVQESVVEKPLEEKTKEEIPKEIVKEKFNETSEEIKENIEAIEKEKEEYLKEHPEEEIEKTSEEIKEKNSDETEKEELVTDEFVEDEFNNKKEDNEDVLGIF